jgi:hypothetical protein
MYDELVEIDCWMHLECVFGQEDDQEMRKYTRSFHGLWEFLNNVNKDDAYFFG